MYAAGRGLLAFVDDRRNCLIRAENGLDGFSGQAEIDGVDPGQHPDENEHDQAHALLAVIGAMGKTDARAGQEQERADRPRGRLIGRRLLEEGGILDEDFGQQQQRAGDEEPDERRDQQRDDRVLDFAPIDPVAENVTGRHQ